MKDRIKIIFALLIIHISSVYSDTIDYWNVKEDNKIKISANPYSFDSTEYLNIYSSDLNKKLEILYFKDVVFDTEKKLVFKRKDSIYSEILFKSSNIVDPMKFYVNDFIHNDLKKNDTIRIYYTELGSKYSSNSLIYIGSFVIKEDIKRGEQKTDYIYYLVAGILVILIGGIIYKSRSRKKQNGYDRFIKEI